MVEKTITKEEFEPLIVAFCCNWCAYAGADLAGTSRFEYPPNVRIIRIMCTGRMDPTLILSALRWGADGVLIAGCHPGDCHYQKGNFMMEKRFGFLKTVVQMVGIDSERVRLEWISASEGGKFAALIREMTNQIKNLGPNPFRKPNPQTGEGGAVNEIERLARKVDAAIEAYKSQRLRWVLGISQVGSRIDEARYRNIINEIIRDEIKRHVIMCALREHGELTVREMAQITGIAPSRTMRHVIALRKNGMVTEAGEKKHEYLYKLTL